MSQCRSGEREGEVHREGEGEDADAIGEMLSGGEVKGIDIEVRSTELFREDGLEGRATERKVPIGGGVKCIESSRRRKL